MARFPAMEPEPPPRPPLVRLLRAVGAVAVVVVAVLAVALVPSLVHSVRARGSGTAARPAPAPASGHVVVVDGLHLGLTDTRGRLQHVLTGDLRTDPTLLSLSPDPSMRSAVTGPSIGFGASSAQRIQLTATAAAAPALPPTLTAGGGLAEQPWADRGRALVVVRGPDVALVDVATSRVTGLGRAAFAAGLPDARAAVVVVGGKSVAQPSGWPPVVTAARIEVRAAGRPAFVLHTAADLAAEAGFPVHEPVVVDRLVVSPDGKHVLVAFDRAGAYEIAAASSAPRLQPAGALVVLSRDGDVESLSRSRPGRGLGWATWSRTGDLALGVTMQSATLNTPDRVLTYWNLRSVPMDIALPGAFGNTLLTPCVWGPASDALLCGDDRGWFDVEPRRPRVTRLSPVTGRPLVWLP